MVQDESEQPTPAPASPHRALLLGGMGAACLLGAGVGLWARPAAHEQPGAQKAEAEAPPPKVDRRLAIVVDDTPAPIGKPLEVLAPAPARPAIAAPLPTPAEPEPVAPKRPPNGLVRVVAPVPGPLAPASAPRPPAARPETPRTHAEAPDHPKAEQAEGRKRQKTTSKEKPEKRRASAAREDAPDTKTADKGRHGLGALTHALAKLAPHHAKSEPSERAEAAAPARRKPAETRLAKTEPRRSKPEPAPPDRVATAETRCASADPGEALACGDPRLSAAERRLNRAYHEAEAAGVPAAVLERQQQRWRAARAAAAREAPWAVRDVYQARIAELQDLARSARGD